jgi:hypothetical protein
MVSFEMKKQQLNGKKEEDLPKTVVYGWPVFQSGVDLFVIRS